MSKPEKLQKLVNRAIATKKAVIVFDVDLLPFWTKIDQKECTLYEGAFWFIRPPNWDKGEDRYDDTRFDTRSRGNIRLF